MHTGTTPCRYEYTMQPPEDLDCNPYTAGVLRIGCTIFYSVTDPAVTLNWLYFPNSNSQAPDLIVRSDGKYTVTPSSFTGSVSSVLQVSPLLDEDAGSYACQAVFTLNGTELTQSQSLVLFSRTAFTSLGFSSCSRSEDHTVRETRCAQIGSNTNPTSGGNNSGGGGGFSLFGDNSGIILAGIGIGVFLVVTTFIIVLCCIIFQCCKYFD